MSGSFSQQSIIVSLTIPVRQASKRAVVSCTEPRQLLTNQQPGFIFSKNALSAKWKVGYFPSRVNGTCRVTISASPNKSSNGKNPLLPSFSALGGSFLSTRIPNNIANRSTCLPTWPTPIIPILFPFRLAFPSLCSNTKREEMTY